MLKTNPNYTLNADHIYIFKIWHASSVWSGHLTSIQQVGPMGSTYKGTNTFNAGRTVELYELSEKDAPGGLRPAVNCLYNVSGHTQ